MFPLKPKSTARLFFDEIKNHQNPYAHLMEIVSPARIDPFFEAEWIDFKGNPQDNKDAKKLWSKALSGYSNITDGLIIWGIDARKTPPRDIDAACGLRLIPDPQVFESNLREWIRDATNPPVMGVEYQFCANESGEGFVVCLIPESNYKPHRAEFADKHYYFRAGDDFLIAEPGFLRTLFYPRNNPYLWLEVVLSFQLRPVDLAEEYMKNPNGFAYNKIINSPSSMSINVTLHNDGSATAKDVFIIFQANNNLNFHPGTDWALRPNPRGQAAFQAMWPIHPGGVSHLFSASFQKEFPTRTEGCDSWEIFPYFDTVSLRFVCYADNFQQEDIVIEFTPNDFSFATCSASKKGAP